MFTVILFLNCSAQKRTSLTNENVILNKEIEIAELFSIEKKAILVLNQNEYLINFIKESKKNGFSVIKSNSNIESEVFNSLFNNETLLNFSKQIENTDLDFKTIKIGANTTIKKSNKKRNNASDFLKDSSHYEITLSKPFISKNGKFGMVSFSRGFMGSKEGGISIYKKTDSTWIKIDTIDSWIE